jgi:hypothetical protein
MAGIIAESKYQNFKQNKITKKKFDIIAQFQ